MGLTIILTVFLLLQYIFIYILLLEKNSSFNKLVDIISERIMKFSVFFTLWSSCIIVGGFLLEKDYFDENYINLLITLYLSLFFSNHINDMRNRLKIYSSNSGQLNIKYFLKDLRIFKIEILYTASQILFISGLLFYLLYPLDDAFKSISVPFFFLSLLTIIFFTLSCYFTKNSKTLKKYVFSMFPFYYVNKDLIEKIIIDKNDFREVLNTIKNSEKYANMSKEFNCKIKKIDYFNSTDDNYINIKKIKVQFSIFAIFMCILINSLLVFICLVYLKIEWNICSLSIYFIADLCIYYKFKKNITNNIIQKIKNSSYFQIVFWNDKHSTLYNHPYSHFLKSIKGSYDIQMIYNNILFIIILCKKNFEQFNDKKYFYNIFTNNQDQNDFSLNEFVLYSICKHMSFDEGKLKSRRYYSKLDRLLFDKFILKLGGNPKDI